MCAQIIEARVKQKKDTLENWEANPMILLDGEQAFVVSDSGQPINFKIGDGTKRFSDLPYWIDYAGGQYIQIEDNVLPEPSVDVGYSFVGPGTYTFAGQPDIVAPEGRLSQLLWDGSSWSLVDMGSLPSYSPTGRIALGQDEAPSGEQAYLDLFDTGQKDLKAILLNKGKLYPMVNYFADSIATVVQFRKALLDAVVYCNDSDEFNYSLVQLNKGHVTSGNRIDIRKKNNQTNETVATYVFRTMGSGSENLSAENRKQLDKLESGAIETVTIIANDNSFKVELTFDTSEFPAGSYNLTMSTGEWKDFVFENSVYRTYDLGGLEQSIDKINDRLPVRFAPSGITLDNPGNIILQSDGEYSPSTGGNSSFKNPIDTTKKYYVSGQMLAASATLVAYYNDNDEYVGNQFPSTGVAFTVNRQEILPTPGATKFAFSSYGTEFKLEVLEDDDVASASELSSLESDLNSVNNQVVQNTSDIADLQGEVNSGVTPDKMVKAVSWEIEMRAREKYLRDLYAQKIIDNPSYVAPYYGVGWSEEHSNSNNVERYGDPALHISLPIQSKIRGCVVIDGVVQYYLSANSDYFKEDGVTPSVLDGTDGDVMVEIPEFFFKWTEFSGGPYKQILISEDAIPDYKFSPKHYIAKYESTVDREEDRLASVVTTNFTRNSEELFIVNAGRYVEADNTGFSLGVQEVADIGSYTSNAAKYRGVTNDDSLDNQLLPTDANYARNQLGRPVSSINRKTARMYAENANGVIQQYDSQKALYYLIMVEYATRNIQQAIAPDVDGKRSGGLGRGATVYPDYAGYEKFFSPQGGNALIPAGVTASLGSRSGEVYFRIKNTPILSTGTGESAVIEEFGTVVMPVMSYRGIENFYGHLYKIVDNIDGRITNLPAGVKRNEYYYQKNPYLTNDTDSVQGYSKIGDAQFLSSIRVISQLLGGTDGHILPIGEGGTNYTQFYSDCVEHIQGWNGNIGDLKYLTYNGRIVSTSLVGLLFSVIAVDVASDRYRASDTVRLQYFGI